LAFRPSSGTTGSLLFAAAGLELGIAVFRPLTLAGVLLVAASTTAAMAAMATSTLSTAETRRLGTGTLSGPPPMIRRSPRRVSVGEGILFTICPEDPASARRGAGFAQQPGDRLLNAKPSA